MKSIKKLLAVLLSVCMLAAMLTLTSCVGNGTNGDNGDNGNNGGNNGITAKTYTVVVVDGDNNPVEGISLFIYDNSYTISEQKITDQNGKVSVAPTLPFAGSLNVMVTGVGESGCIMPENPMFAFEGDSQECKIILQKPAAEEMVIHNVTVTDQNGNPVAGVTMQLCIKLCQPCTPTDASGKTSCGIAESSLAEGSVMLKLLSVPEGYSKPEEVNADGYHYIFADGETDVIIVITKN